MLLNYSDQLDNKSSPEFIQLSDKVSKELYKVFRPLYPNTLIRVIINKFTNGSIITDMTLTFKANNTAPSNTEVVNTLYKMVNTSGYANGLPLDRNSIQSNAAAHLWQSSKRKPDECAILLLQVTSPSRRGGQLRGEPPLTVWVISYSNSSNWTQASLILQLSAKQAASTPTIISNILATPSPSLTYTEDSLQVNGSQAPIQVFPFDLRILNKAFVAGMSSQTSSLFKDFSNQVIQSVTSLFSEKAGFSQVYVSQLRNGSVIASTNISYASGTSNRDNVAQVLYSGITQLSLDGLELDPASVTPAATPLAQPFPGFAVAIIVMCSLAILAIPIILVVSDAPIVKLVQRKKVPSTKEIRSPIGQATAALTSLEWCLWKKPNIILNTKMSRSSCRVCPMDAGSMASIGPEATRGISNVTPAKDSPQLNLRSYPKRSHPENVRNNRLTSSTAPPTVTSTLPLVAAPVVFKMNQQFKSELSNRSSPEFKVLSDQVSGEIQMIVLTSFGTPESDNLTSIIKQQLMVILSLAYNGTIINSNVSTSNSNGWTLMTANYELNTPNIQPESVVLQQIHSNSSVNYDQTSLVVNGSVVANTQFIFKQNTISDAQVQQVILNGASNLTADGIVIDPASFSTFSTTTTSTSTASPNSTSSAPQATQANGTQPAAATPTSMAPANGTTQSNTTTITAAPNNHTDSASSQNNTMFTSAAPKNNSTLITMQGNITSASPPLNNSTNSTVAQHNTPTALNSTTSTSVQNNTTFTTSAANSNTTSMTAAPSNTTATGKDNTTAFTTAVPNNATSTTIQNNGTNSTATQTVATATQTVATSVTTANGTNSTATQTIATSVTTANGTNATATQTVTTSVTTATSTNSTATQTVATSVTTATSTNSTATQTVATSVTTATSTNSTATQTVATSVTTATSTNPPTTSTPSSSANSTVSLQFTIMDSFTPDLNNPASEAYKNITGRIISALDKVFIFQFKEKFNRTEIRKLSSGSIKVEADCIFNANTNVTSTEVVRSVVQGINSGVLSTLNINESTISSNNVTVRTLGPITVHIELIVLIGFSSAPQLNSILDSWLQPFLMAKYNASSVSGNYTYRRVSLPSAKVAMGCLPHFSSNHLPSPLPNSDSNGWTKVVTDKVVNTTLQLPDDNVFQGLVASTSPVLYQISSVKINNFIAQSQYQTFQQSFRITNKNFDSTLSNKSSAQFMSLSQEVINTLVKTGACRKLSHAFTLKTPSSADLRIPLWDVGLSSGFENWRFHKTLYM
ncbi:ZAN protein, partial [Polypterus senegalus]